MSPCEGFTSGFAWKNEVGGVNCVGVVVTPKLIRGLIKVLTVEVAVVLGGHIAGTDTIDTGVGCKEGGT